MNDSIHPLEMNDSFGSDSFYEQPEGVRITEEALKRLFQIRKDNQNVELSVEAGGCSGLNYNFKLVDREPNDRDKIIDISKDMVLLVPFDSYVYLLGTTVDYSDDLLNGGFKFENPNAERGCGCGTSFSV